LKESGLIICNSVKISGRQEIIGEMLLPSSVDSTLSSSTQMWH